MLNVYVKHGRFAFVAMLGRGPWLTFLRDERNEYHGITIERAQRVMDAVGGAVTIRYEGAPRVA